MKQREHFRPTKYGTGTITVLYGIHYKHFSKVKHFKILLNVNLRITFF